MAYKLWSQSQMQTAWDREPRTLKWNCNFYMLLHQVVYQTSWVGRIKVKCSSPAAAVRTPCMPHFCYMWIIPSNYMFWCIAKLVSPKKALVLSWEKILLNQFNCILVITLCVVIYELVFLEHFYQFCLINFLSAHTH